MIYRFYSIALKKILSLDAPYPYYVTPKGQVIAIEPEMYKKEPSFKEIAQKGIGYHLCSELKDSNGHYIFEGDIVSAKDQKGDIVFTNGCFIFKDVVSGKATPLLKLPKEQLNIVGNSVENPTKNKKTIAVAPFEKK